MFGLSYIFVKMVGDTHSQPLPPVDDEHNDSDPIKSNSTSASRCCYPHYLILWSNEVHDREKVEAFLEMVCIIREEDDDGRSVVNGILAQDLLQARAFWNLRESCNPAAAATGYTYKYDISLLGCNFGDFIDDIKQRLHGKKYVVITNWGHILDSDLHLNVTTVGNFSVDATILSLLEPYLFEAVLDRGGSISAEHGIGPEKSKLMEMIHDRTKLSAMRALKAVFDPAGIMNPGKLLPDE
jgi:FAD/FMN-containing dehydrogenase